MDQQRCLRIVQNRVDRPYGCLPGRQQRARANPRTYLRAGRRGRHPLLAHQVHGDKRLLLDALNRDARHLAAAYRFEDRSAPARSVLLRRRYGRR